MAQSYSQSLSAPFEMSAVFAGGQHNAHNSVFIGDSPRAFCLTATSLNSYPYKVMLFGPISRVPEYRQLE